MKKEMTGDLEILAHAAEILSREMSPSQFARIFSILRLGKGDYLALKDRLFGDESIESLIQQIR
jgi:hypothetical protein